MTRMIRDMIFFLAALLVVVLALLCGGCGLKGFEDDGPDHTDPTTRPIGVSDDGKIDAREAVHDPRLDQAVNALGIGIPAGIVLLVGRLFFPRKKAKPHEGGSQPPGG